MFSKNKTGRLKRHAHRHLYDIARSHLFKGQIFLPVPRGCRVEWGAAGSRLDTVTDGEAIVANTNYMLNENLCKGCGLCVKVCAGGTLSLDAMGKPRIAEADEWGWDGCWRCQHCLAVCPTGAISILGKKPEYSLAPAAPELAAPTLDALIANRRSCRRYLDKNVDKVLIEEMLEKLQCAPNGGNRQAVEYTLIDDRDDMRYLHDRVYKEMERLADQGVYPQWFDAESFDQMKKWESTVRPDMLFCSVPHILIPHAKRDMNCWTQDVIIAGAYFELLCASRGLGAICMTFPLDVLSLMPDMQALLEIPEDHYIGMIVGFGYPEIVYERGIQRYDSARVHRLKFGHLEQGVE